MIIKNKAAGGIGFFRNTEKDFIPLFNEKAVHHMSRQKEVLQICVELSDM